MMHLKTNSSNVGDANYVNLYNFTQDQYRITKAIRNKGKKVRVQCYYPELLLVDARQCGLVE